MNLLVTGGAGYIGSHAVRHLARQGHEVWVYDDLSTGHAEAVPAGRLLEGDIGDAARLTAVSRELRIEAVLHFAALSVVGDSESDPALYYRRNVVGSLALLDALRAAGVRRIVFSSTTSVHGAVDHMPVAEDAPLRPASAYGFTKLVVERILADYAQAYGLGSISLRYFNAAGASLEGDLGEDHMPETHLIPRALEVALGRRDRLLIYGNDYPTRDGTCIRDYVHIDDLARAHATALDFTLPGAAQVVNLGSGRGHSVLEVVEACRRVTGQSIPIEFAPRRPGDPPEIVADIRRAAELFAWRPELSSLETIVETSWRWHRDHPHGFRSG